MALACWLKQVSQIMRRLIKKFMRQDERGVSAIEFALLAPAFFMLMIAIFEICYFIYASTATQRALEKAILDIRTNHAQTVVNSSGMAIPEWYEQAICSRVSIPTCKDTIAVTVETYDEHGNRVWGTSNPEELRLGPRQTLMRVEVSIDAPEVMFTGLIFGDNGTTLNTGLTFMTEP